MSVQENVEFPAVFLRRSSSSSSDSHTRALELLEILGIKDKAKQKPVESKWRRATKSGHRKSSDK